MDSLINMMIIIVLISCFTIGLCLVPKWVLDQLPDENSMMEDIGATMTSMPYEDPLQPGKVVIEYFANTVLSNDTAPSDIIYYFYSRNNPQQGIAVDRKSVAGEFNALKDTLFIIHGWKNNHESPVNTLIKNAVLSKHDINVFVVDWSVISMKNYISAQWAVRKVGEYVAEFIKDLETHHGLQLSGTMLVGHSLGAHVSGNAGAALYGNLRHIVGLDPAMPLFSTFYTENRLDPTDAKYVQAIHTSALRLGFWSPIGDSDFFPNGGYKQRGCGIDLFGICAHSMAYQYYAESIELQENNFVGTSCFFYKTYLLGLCKDGEKVKMGDLYVDTRASGNYYLYTNPSYPHGRGNEEPSLMDEAEISLESVSSMLPVFPGN